MNKLYLKSGLPKLGVAERKPILNKVLYVLLSLHGKIRKFRQFSKSFRQGPFFFLLINVELHVKGRGKLRKYERGREPKSLGSPDIAYFHYVKFNIEENQGHCS